MGPDELYKSERVCGVSFPNPLLSPTLTLRQRYVPPTRFTRFSKHYIKSDHSWHYGRPWFTNGILQLILHWGGGVVGVLCAAPQNICMMGLNRQLIRVSCSVTYLSHITTNGPKYSLNPHLTRQCFGRWFASYGAL